MKGHIEKIEEVDSPEYSGIKVTIFLPYPQVYYRQIYEHDRDKCYTEGLNTLDRINQRLTLNEMYSFHIGSCEVLQ